MLSDILISEPLAAVGAELGDDAVLLHGPAALAAPDLFGREPGRAALVAEAAGVDGAAEALPAGLLCRRSGLGIAAAGAEFAGICGTAALADPAGSGRCSRCGRTVIARIAAGIARCAAEHTAVLHLGRRGA